MPIRCSLVTATRASNTPGLAWHRAQAGPAVELIVVENPGRSGLGAAWNEGLAAARGEYCCFIHDDVEVQTPDWLERLATAVERHGFDLLGVAGTRRLPRSGAWWTGMEGQSRGEVWHRLPDGALRHNQYGPPDDAARGLSEVVSLDGLLLFGRRAHFLSEPFDTEFLDGFHFYDADLCLRWLTRRGRRIGVLHGLRVIHDSSGEIAGMEQFQPRLFGRFGGLLPLDAAGVALWRRNLEALRLFAPRAAAILAAGRVPGRILLLEWRDRDDHPSERVLHALTDTGAIPIADQDLELRELPDARRLVLLGIGDGRILDQALRDPNRRILVIEPEGQLLLNLLARLDLSAPLAAGRLHLAIPTLDHPGLAAIGQMETLAGLQRDALDADAPPLVRTGSTRLNPDFFALLEQGVERMPTVARRVAPVPAAMAFDLAVISPCCAIFDDLAGCFADLGLRVRLFRVPDRPGVWTPDDWRSALDALRAQPAPVTVLRNRALIETERPEDRWDPERFLPGRLVSWWWDVPNVASCIDLECATLERPALAFARDLLPLLPAGSQWLPPGARRSSVAGPDPAPDAPTAPVISFVGQSRLSALRDCLNMLGGALAIRRGRAGSLLARDLDRHLHQRRDMVALHDFLAREEPALRQAIAGLRPAFPHQAHYLDYLLSMSLTGAFRIAAIATLTAAGLPVVVHGDDEWLQTGALDPVRFRGIAMPEALPALYRRSRVNLNLNFMQVASTVNPKVLDIAAAGGTVLTDVRPELAWLYPDPARRPFGFKTLDELPERAAALLAHEYPHQRAAVQAHTRARHLLSQRARWLLEWLDLGPTIAQPR